MGRLHALLHTTTHGDCQPPGVTSRCPAPLPWCMEASLPWGQLAPPMSSDAVGCPAHPLPCTHVPACLLFRAPLAPFTHMPAPPGGHQAVPRCGAGCGHVWAEGLPAVARDHAHGAGPGPGRGGGGHAHLQRSRRLGHEQVCMGGGGPGGGRICVAAVELGVQRMACCCCAALSGWSYLTVQHICWMVVTAAAAKTTAQQHQHAGHSW